MSASVFELLLISICFVSHCKAQNEMCIIPNDGGNRKPSPSCKITLNQFCKDAGKLKNDSVITLLKETYGLNNTCEIKYITNLTLIGSGAVVECSPSKESGFRFLNVSNLKISDIEFKSCGSTWNFTLPKFYGSFPDTIVSALSFLDGRDLLLSHVRVLNGRSAGIYISNVAGNVTVDSCEVSNASSSTLDSLSGNVIVYDDNLTNTTSLRIEYSKFASSGYKFIDEKCKQDDAFSFSSGLVLYLGSAKVTIDIVNTNFSQNIGCNGGNMAILFFKFASVILTTVQFEGGKASYGGGMYVTFQNSFLDKYSRTDYTYSPKVLSIVDSTFVDNFAENSGGGMYVQWKQSTRLNGSAEVEVIDTEFRGNSLGVRGRWGG